MCVGGERRAEASSVFTLAPTDTPTLTATDTVWNSERARRGGVSPLSSTGTAAALTRTTL